VSVGLLLITHNGIGTALLGTVTRMLGGCPLQARVLAVHEEGDCDRLCSLALDWALALDAGDGVLVLTDLFGSTPANIAAALQVRNAVRVVSGVNLPMLVRVLNYSGLALDALAEKAVSGGRDGVMCSRRPEAAAGAPKEACKP
jgi:PTS system ascorbate-specific IIA component